MYNNFLSWVKRNVFFYQSGKKLTYVSTCFISILSTCLAIRCLLVSRLTSLKFDFFYGICSPFRIGKSFKNALKITDTLMTQITPFGVVLSRHTYDTWTLTNYDVFNINKGNHIFNCFWITYTIKFDLVSGSLSKYLLCILRK